MTAPPTAAGAALRDELGTLVLDLLAAPSPNPPGDVRDVAGVVTAYCERAGLPHRLDRPAARRRNIVVDVLGPAGRDGRHLVWNGHLDTFPASGPPSRPRRVADRVHGRGAVDMKGGVAAFLVAARRLRGSAGDLPGRLSLVLVCDEETFGPLGARGLLRRRPDLLGDALVSTEPSSLGLVRVAERGYLWLMVHVPGQSMHAAYPGAGEGAILRAAGFARRLAGLVAEVNRGLAAAHPPPAARDEAMDRLLGDGAARIVREVSLNLGTVRGGLAVNMRPADCRLSVDLRVPETVDPQDLLGRVEELAREAGARVEVLGRGPANSTGEDADIVTAVTEAVTRRTGHRPVPSTGIGCTDARLWRHAGVPACVIGPDPATMGTDDEHVRLAELEALVDILCDSARQYLSGES
ncbi:M20 family metallopeptidase [Nonomuraea ferruginea]